MSHVSSQSSVLTNNKPDRRPTIIHEELLIRNESGLTSRRGSSVLMKSSMPSSMELLGLKTLSKHDSETSIQSYRSEARHVFDDDINEKRALKVLKAKKYVTDSSELN